MHRKRKVHENTCINFVCDVYKVGGIIVIQLDDTFIKSYVKQAQLQRMEQQAQFAHTAL